MIDDRDKKGRYTKRHSDAEVLAAVRAHEPAATSEVAGELGIERQSADYRLRKLRDAGQVNSKKIAASLVWFDASSGGTNITTSAGSEPAEEPPGDVLERIDAEEGIPGDLDREELLAATEAARAFLEEEGRARKGDFVLAVMPKHPLKYDAEEAADTLEAGERYRGKWWRLIREGLKAYPGVKEPANPADQWVYDGSGR